MEELKKTCLHSRHLALNAKMSPFAGFNMPIQYSSITQEHNSVRNSAGIFDVSHMGQIRVTGVDAGDFVNYIFTNDVVQIHNGKIVYGMMLYPNGGTLDDLLVYKEKDDSYLLVINAANIDKVLAWIISNKSDYNVNIENLSDYFGQVAIQGPNSVKVIEDVMGIEVDDLKYYSFKTVLFRENQIIISRTGYTGEDGFEIYGSEEIIKFIWDIFITSERIAPCGLGCRDTLRFEAGFPLYGHELSETITPIMAGLSMFIKFDKETFIGKEALIKEKKEGPAKKIVGIVLLEKSVPRAGYTVQIDGKDVGYVTTGYISISTGQAICMALVDPEASRPGTSVGIVIRNKILPAVVTKRGSWKKRTN
ncbi:MAG TPA: glycine cleavage system aminomethyltransferase GcvT [Bacteroidaceae bacterium]|nr:glycine cleavage system aminomethyltransferase GcvT [Bacteroidaceae bacterium]